MVWSALCSHSSSDEFCNFFSRIGQIGCVYQLQAGLAEYPPPFLDIGPFHPDNDGYRQLHLLRSLNNTLGKDITAQYSAEDIDP